jgi:hypothetical protein
LYRWIKALINWIAEPRLFWLCLFVIVISVCFVFLGGTSEPKIRIIGMILQLCGVVTVAWGVREARKLFGHPDFFQLMLAWAKRFPKYHLKPITGELDVTLPGYSVSGSGYSWQTTGPDTPIDERLAAIEANLSTLNVRLDQTQEQLGHVTRTINSQLHEERLLRETEDQETRKKLEAAQTGGLRISMVGLFWLSLGVIMSSASVELAKLIK